MLYGLTEDEFEYDEDTEDILILNGLPAHIMLVVTPDDRVWRTHLPTWGYEDKTFLESDTAYASPLAIVTA